MQQMAFSFDHDKNSLKTYLEKATRKPVFLIITDNSTSVLSIKEKGNSVLIRLHRMFLSAGKDVLSELSDYIRGRKRKTPLIRSFINRNTHYLKQKPPRRVTVQTQGKYYNLIDICHFLNRTYFEGKLSASITWGTKGPRRVARRRTLGSYSANNHMIRINPVLDSKRVPRYFLEYIIYHEMMHAEMGIETDTGRRSIHSKEFKNRERQFRHYKRALAWERKRWGQCQ